MKFSHIFKGILFVTLSVSFGFSQNLLNIGIGPTWPKGLRDLDKKTAWNATIEYGKLFDNIIGFGIDVDFSWNVTSTDSTVITTGPQSDTFQVELEANRFFMFPISGFILVDPIPKYKVHPVIKGQVGFNMGVKSYKGVDSTGVVIESPKNGFYIGVIGKASADAVFDLGEHAAIFAGFEFQWYKLNHKRRDTGSDLDKKDTFEIYGPGIRMGFSFLF